MSDHTISPQPGEFFNTRAAAQRAGMSVDSIVNAIASGDLLAYRPSTHAHWRIRVTDLDAWLTAQSNRQTAAS